MLYQSQLARAEETHICTVQVLLSRSQTLATTAGKHLYPLLSYVMSSNFGHILPSLPFPFIFQYSNISPKLTQPLNIFVQFLALAVSQQGLNHVHAEIMAGLAMMWAKPAFWQTDLCPLSSWEGIPWNQYCGILHYCSSISVNFKTQISIFTPSTVNCSALLTALCADSTFLLMDHHYLLILLKNSVSLPLHSLLHTLFLSLWSSRVLAVSKGDVNYTICWSTGYKNQSCLTKGVLRIFGRQGLFVLSPL